jgi:hypothetical protein
MGNELIPEDWERTHLQEEMYLRELEYQEKEYFRKKNNPAKINFMGEIEIAKCDFCKKEKSVVRTYLYPSKFKKPETLEEKNKLHNQGDYFHYISSCIDCGEPTTNKN